MAAKKRKQIRLSERSILIIENLTKNKNLNQTELIELALAELYKAEASAEKTIQKIYDLVTEETILLQNKRDYTEEGLNEIEQELEKYLDKQFDEIRKLKGFFETHFMKDYKGDWLLDENGQPVIDQNHEKNRPL